MPRVEFDDHRGGVARGHAARADPETIAETERAEIAKPFAFPDPVLEPLDGVFGQCRHPQRLAERPGEVVERGVGIEQRGDARPRPQRRLAR